MGERGSGVIGGAKINRQTKTLFQIVKALLRPTIGEYDKKLRTAISRPVGLAFLAAFVVIGFTLLFVKPLPVLTCRYVESRQVDCQLTQHIIWVIPVRKIPVPDLEDVYVERETEIRMDDDDNETTAHWYRVMLVSASGETELQSAEENELSSELTRGRIKAYLDTPADKPLTVWGYGLVVHTLCTLPGLLLVVLFGVLLATTIVSSLVLVVAWSVDLVLVIAAWIAGIVGLEPAVTDRLNHVRGVIKDVATRPDD